MGSGSVKNAASKEEVEKAVNEGVPVILHFWATWCDASKHMDQVFSHLSTDFPHVHFFRVEAEEQPEISEAFSVSAVPYFVFFKDGKAVDTLEGADPSSLANKVAKVAGSTGRSDDLNKKLLKLINSHPVMLFMKGTPEEPQCGFSQKVVDILNKEKVQYGSFDIFTDQEIREGLKKFSNWPTYPQLYCKGELLGGCDIVISMHEGGELKDVFRDHEIDPTDRKPVESGNGKGGVTASTGLSASVTSRLLSLINSSPVMLFMKGTPEEPKCGFSRKVLEILKQEKVEFKSFDILTDSEVRQGLKVHSNWSSYPQLYIKGELIGGSDVVLEMQKSGELRRVLAEKGVIIPQESLDDRLKKLVSSSPVVLFMKGNPDSPKCGFSSKVVNALKEEGVAFGSFDILSDEAVRQGLKNFSNWPTYPQLYYKGELVGGCDIILELKNNGELKSTLSE
ncbi:hypothetical protein SOVF_136490 [Spinacia oleracea]|nr:hypothetical protein SOVF_136490 [Spinacia oleracea]